MIDEKQPFVKDLNSSYEQEEDESELHVKRKSCQMYSKVILSDEGLLNTLNEIKSEQKQIQVAQEQIKEKNDNFLKRLEFIKATIEIKGKSRQEISSLEGVLLQTKQNLEEMFSVEGISAHIKKDHNFQGTNFSDFASFYYYLLSKAFIYYNWETFHCTKCLKYVRQNSKQIWELIRQYEELASQINDIKYCCI